jgi:hypothetical protein
VAQLCRYARLVHRWAFLSAPGQLLSCCCSCAVMAGSMSQGLHTLIPTFNTLVAVEGHVWGLDIVGTKVRAWSCSRSQPNEWGSQLAATGTRGWGGQCCWPGLTCTLPFCRCACGPARMAMSDGSCTKLLDTAWRGGGLGGGMLA